MNKDVVDKIISYECGMLDDVEILNLFAELIETGKVWNLQGSYGRTAEALIESDYIDRDGNILIDLEELEDEE